mgnify:FL=1|tara:strand:- start:1726 stop:2001 length:276 start_codon:yes stop_codon:yes gene_type:complete
MKIKFSVDDWHGFEIDGVQYDLNLYADQDTSIQATIYRCTKDENGTWSTETGAENNILECSSEIEIEIVQDRPDTPDIDSIAERNYENRRT